MPHGLITDGLLLLSTSVLLAILLRRFRLPPVLLYLLVGTIIGPAALGWLNEGKSIHLLGEIGIAFLLFSIGLEFSFVQLWAMRKILLGLGAVQVLLGTMSGMAIAWWFGIAPIPAFIVGGALAMSSTAIVMKQLADQMEVQSSHGKLALGVLLFQDIAAIPFLVLIPLVAVAEPSFDLALLWKIGQIILVAGLVLLVGRWVLRPLFLQVTRLASMEVFTLTVLLVSLLAAWITSLTGASYALGAFLAGIMLSETEYRHQIESELRPFKDILLGLFFVTVGMQLDLRSFLDIWPWVLLLVIGLVLGKGGLISLLVYWFERNKPLAFRSGLILGHGGEFGLVLVALAVSSGLLTVSDSQPILSAIIATMVIATFFIRHHDRLVAFLTTQSLGKIVDTSESAHDVADKTDLSSTLADKTHHVVICGVGRVGQEVAKLLRSQGTSYVALDMHSEAVKAAWEDGEPVYYGDASHRSVLEAVGIKRASALVITFDQDDQALRIIRQARQLAPDVIILVRSRDEQSAAPLLAAGASQVIPETLQTSRMLSLQLLLAMGVEDKLINAQLRAMQENYSRPRMPLSDLDSTD